jgi:hypothetical protein
MHEENSVTENNLVIFHESTEKTMETTSSESHSQLPSENSHRTVTDEILEYSEQPTTEYFIKSTDRSFENELHEEPNKIYTQSVESTTENISENETTSPDEIDQEAKTIEESNVKENPSSESKIPPQTTDINEITTSNEASTEELSSITESPQTPTPKCYSCIKSSVPIKSSQESIETTTAYEETVEVHHNEPSTDVKGPDTTESTIYPGHHPSHTPESTVADQSHQESSTEYSNHESTQQQTSPHPSSTTSEEIINERTTSAPIYQSAESTTYSSFEHNESSSTSQFSSSEAIMGGTVSSEVSETASTELDVHQNETPDYDDDNETTGTCFDFRNDNGDEDVELEESYTTPIISKYHRKLRKLQN